MALLKLAAAHAVGVASQTRKERRDRMDYYGRLQTQTARVEEEMAQLQRPLGMRRVSVEVQQTDLGELPQDSGAELALSKVRVQKLLSSLHLDASVHALKDVYSWLDGAADSSGENEKKYQTLEEEGVELTSTMVRGSQLVHSDLSARHQLASDRLGGFNTSLGGFASEKRRRDAERRRKLRGEEGEEADEAVSEGGGGRGLGGLDSDAVQLELTAGLLRAQLLRHEERGGGGKGRNQRAHASESARSMADLDEKV
jgi:hypothetical protein